MLAKITTMSARSAQWKIGLPHTDQARGHGAEHVAPALRPDAEIRERLGRDRQDFRRAQGGVARDLEIVALGHRVFVRERGLGERAPLVHRGLRSLPRAHSGGERERNDAREKTGDVNAWCRPIARTTGSMSGYADAHAATCGFDGPPCGMNVAAIDQTPTNTRSQVARPPSRGTGPSAPEPCGSLDLAQRFGRHRIDDPDPWPYVTTV